MCRSKSKEVAGQEIKKVHTTFKYHIPIPLQINQRKLAYRYYTGKSPTLAWPQRAWWADRDRIGMRQSL